LPCAVIAAGDDAAALEVSLIENFTRLSPSEVENWSAFVGLIKGGRTSEDTQLSHLAGGEQSPPVSLVYTSISLCYIKV